VLSEDEVRVSHPADSIEHRREPIMIFIMGKHAGALSFGYLFFEQERKVTRP